MKERPILFSAPMVRAILEGRKTQTRRTMKPQPWARPEPEDGLWRLYAGDEGMAPFPCPYGQPGDRLWVRETYFGNHFLHPNEPASERELHYRADGVPDFEGEESLIRWRPSIHMPRWASRILLEITGVRVERVQDITVEDCLAEGIDTEGDDYNEGEKLQSAGSPVSAERYAFASLWNSINAKRGFGWDANPWVWVVDFRKVEA